MIGQSMAGILSSLLSIACQRFTANALLSGRFFFMIACAWTVLSGIVYELLIRSEKIEILTIRGGEFIDQSSSERLLGNCILESLSKFVLVVITAAVAVLTNYI
ncbi:unnamed protein product [Gongylonema pulchrum]|uniref:Solute carrier family 40 protein n=1 Tax=Gongylonema pulchrum TaxID=637853 RepID=A0A183DAL0_9BILA|nr:unnamed protein product [Gongylonema pulchrum]